ACAGRSRATETVGAIRELGRRVLDIEADLSSIGPIPHVIEQIIDGLGGLDILVNNAGIIRRADSLQVSEADWDEVLDTNLKSAFFLAQAAARHMIAQGRGKIINIASMLSFQGGIRVASYTASKSAIAGVTRLLASEWAPHGINVNAIAPGYIATRNTAALQSDAVRNRQILDRIPAGRWGAPQDLTGAAVFLASAASDYVHGHILAVDGGWLAR
ncbi:MAG: SDR family oxidoreductase, partial [Steroidobacteraceae bacterium]